MAARWIVPLSFLLASACRMSPVQLEPVATSVQRPSNIAIYVEASRSGEPLTNLTLESFRIYEDGTPLDADQVQAVLLPKDGTVEHRTLLLLDMTGATTSVQKRWLSQAAAEFVREVRKQQPVSIHLFDGSERIHRVDDLPRDPAAAEPTSLPVLESFAIGDRSRNLNGALLEGLSALDKELSASDKPVHVGTLVVLTTGPDLAGRVASEQVDAALERSRHDVMLIDVHDGHQTIVARRATLPTFRAESISTSKQAFREAAARVKADHASHYLLSYCSPARGGVRELRIEIEIPGEKNRPLVGETELEFSADGFAAGCNSRDLPKFLVTMVSGGVPGLPPSGAPPPAEPEPTAEAAPEPEAEEPKAKPRPRPRWRPRPAAKPAPPPAKPDKPANKPDKPAPSPPGEPPDFEP